ncbi:TPA: type IV pilus biogenesis protein PilP [Yersinia enterocolitica]|nr:type IV pilus biogenesis protein PilP [Yersinia enterocolitica]
MVKSKLIKNRVYFLLLSIIISCSVSANEISEVKSVWDLDVLQSQTTYLKALAAFQEAKDKSGGTMPIVGSVAPGVNSAQKILLPQVIKIVGNGSGLSVRLVLSNGTEMTKKKGDSIPGGYKLTKVTLDEVSISDAAGTSFILSEVGN